MGNTSNPAREIIVHTSRSLSSQVLEYYGQGLGRIRLRTKRLRVARKSIRIDFLYYILSVLSRLINGIINLVASRFTACLQVFHRLVDFFAGPFQRPLFFTGKEKHQ